MPELSHVAIGVSHQIGHYSDGVRIPAGYDQIVVSGTPGVTAVGSVPEDFTAEATQAWQNVGNILAKAGADLSDIVAVRQWLTRVDLIEEYVKVRSKFLTHEPTFMLGVVDALVWPTIRVEIEVVAAVPAPD
jgi:enamine deaminase RidA (YjgF/YER057c/UK114 family)